MEISHIYARLALIMKNMKEDKLHRRESFSMVFDLLMDVVESTNKLEEDGK